MYETVLALTIASLGFSAYRAARRQGLWSWKLFAAVLVAAAALVFVATAAARLALHMLGPGHPGLVTLLVVSVIAVGVSVIAWLARPRGAGRTAHGP